MNESNKIRQSLSKIRADEELKKKTLQYLLSRQEKNTGLRRHPVLRYALAAICMFLLLGTGGYSVYSQPVSYISVDVNPSVELGVNRFGRVVSADAYNEDGQAVLQLLSLKNIPYVQAIGTLLANESSFGFLKEDSVLVLTVISPKYTSILDELSAADFSQNYETLLYTSDVSCMEEAHSHEMSFGKYRGYQELSQYDASITIEDCHNMTMEEINSRIKSCSGHQNGNGPQHHGSSPAQTTAPSQTTTSKPAGAGHHRGHH